MARPFRMTAPNKNRLLLLAYVAVDAASLAAALNALADQSDASRSGAYQAQEMADQMSWRWCQQMDLGITDPTDRLIAARDFLTEHVDALEELLAEVL